MEQRALMADQIINGRVIEACQRGDRDAFRVLFETYKDKVYSIAVYSIGGDKSVAEDVTQQIFLKLFTAIQQFRGDSEFTTWLYRLVVNACMDERRKRRKLLPWGESFAFTPTHKKPQEKQYARVEIAEAVQLAIGELKEQVLRERLQRHVFRISAAAPVDRHRRPARVVAEGERGVGDLDLAPAFRDVGQPERDVALAKHLAVKV